MKNFIPLNKPAPKLSNRARELIKLSDRARAEIAKRAKEIYFL